MTKPMMGCFRLRGHLGNEIAIWSELRPVVERDDQRDEHQRHVGERQPETGALDRAT